MTNWFLYILCCADHTLYTGVTTDLQRRLHEHNHLKCGAKYTRHRRPVHLVYSEQHVSRSSACKREYQIKQLSHQQKLDLINTP
jgi:putative endonuclease